MKKIRNKGARHVSGRAVVLLLGVLLMFGRGIAAASDCPRKDNGEPVDTNHPYCRETPEQMQKGREDWSEQEKAEQRRLCNLRGRRTPAGGCEYEAHKLGIGAATTHNEDEKPTFKYEGSNKIFPNLQACRKAVRDISDTTRRNIFNGKAPSHTIINQRKGAYTEVHEWDLPNGTIKHFMAACLPAWWSEKQ